MQLSESNFARGVSSNSRLSVLFVHVFLTVGFLIITGAFTLQLSGIDPHVGVTESLRENGSMVMQILLGVSYLGAVVLVVGSRDALNVAARAWPILILPILAFVSISWSPDGYMTLRKSIAFLGTILFGLSMAARLPPADCIRLLVRAMTLETVLSVIWVIVFPYYGVHQETDSAIFESIHHGLWRGVLAHRVELGFFSALTFSLLVFYGPIVFHSRMLRYCGIGLSVACLLGAQSGLGFVTAAIATSLLFLISWIARSNMHGRFVLIIMVLLSAIILSFFASIIFTVLLEFLGKQPDITGRTVFWHYVISLIAERPLFGYGYFAGFALTVGPMIDGVAHIHLVNTHNGYLEALVAFGYVGSAICFAVLIWLLWNAILMIAKGSAALGKINAFPLSMLVIVFLASLVEAMLIKENHISVVLMAMSAGLIARESRAQIVSGVYSNRMRKQRSYATRNVTNLRT